MSLRYWRDHRIAAPVVLITLACFLSTLLPTRSSFASTADATGPIPIGTGGPQSIKNADVSSQSIASLTTVDIATGAAQTGFAFQLETARGEAQPGLALRYNSSQGVGFAGVGWTLTTPSIVRKGSAGVPRFDEPVQSALHPSDLGYGLDPDTYWIDGQLLTPVAVVTSEGHVAAGTVLPGEAFPFFVLNQAQGFWVYFRREVDDGSRYFLSPDVDTWIVQTPSGHLLQFGHPLDGLLTDGIEFPDPLTGTTLIAATTGFQQPYRWNLVRDTDDTGANTVYYAWDDEHQLFPGSMKTAGTMFLKDIYDTLPPVHGNDALGAALAQAAHHVHLTWELAQYSLQNGTFPAGKAPLVVPYAFSPIWRALPFAQLARVDVTSATWTSSATRQMVRSYTLNYTSNTSGTRNFLTSVQMVGGSCCPTPGGCATTAQEAALTEDSNGTVPQTAPFSGTGITPTGPFLATFACNGLPPTTFSYSGLSVNGQTDGVPGLLRTAFFPFQISSPVRALVDLNGDAIADLVSTPPSSSGQMALVQLGPSQPVLVQNASGWDWSSAIFSDWASTGQLSLLTSTSAPYRWLEAQPPVLGRIDFAPFGSAFTPSLTAADTAYYSTVASVAVASRAVDVDGDGLADIALAPVSTEVGPGYQTLFSVRDKQGLAHPFRAPGQSYCTSPAMDPTKFGVQIQDAITIQEGAFIFGRIIPLPSPAIRAMADMDGDGLPDLVMANKVRCTTCAQSAANPADGQANFPLFEVFENRGDGRFGVPASSGSSLTVDAGITSGSPSPSSACYASFASGILPITNLFPPPVADSSASVQSDPIGPDLFGNSDGAFDANGEPVPGNSVLRFGDINGDGYADFAVLNSRGLSVCLRGGGAYDTARFRCTLDTTHNNQTSGKPDPNKTIEIADLDGSGINQVIYFDLYGSEAFLYSPSGQPGFRDGLLLTISNGSGASTSFTYATVASLGVGAMPEAAWVVRGISTSNGLVGAPAVNSSWQYDYQQPIFDARDRTFVGFRSATATVLNGTQNAPGTVTTTTFATDTCGSSANTACSTAYTHATRGLPAVVQVSDPVHGTKYSTVVNEYQMQTPYGPTLDGRSVAIVSLYQQHTYLWGQTQQQSTAAVRPIVGQPLSLSVVLPSPLVELRRQSTIDSRHHEISTVDFGLVGTDKPIVQKRMWQLPPYDRTGWSYRVTQVQTGYSDSTGTTFAGAVSEYDYDYDSYGQLLNAWGVLDAAPELPGPTGLATRRAAPQPPDASVPGKINLSSFTYDEFGNAYLISHGLGGKGMSRCVNFTFDPVYAQLPTTQVVYPNGCASTPTLTTSAVYDRGKERVTSTLSPTGLLTLAYYDDFGRVTEVHENSSSTPGITTLSATVGYEDASPVHRVHVTTFTGNEAAPDAVDHFRYIDGLGHLVERIDQGGTANNPVWIVSGMSDRYATGQVQHAYAPFAIATSPAKLAPGSLPVTAAASSAATSTYDALGRIVTTTDFLGNKSKTDYGLGTLSWTYQDAEQLSGARPNSSTTTTIDGHGRVVATDQATYVTGLGPGHLTTATTYGATGEPLTITQQFPGVSTTRSLVYDSLGRVIANREPNSGGWFYAYNDLGELVGTSDARGCGENFFHDGVGRVVAEDYSPCDGSQPTYTPADPATGLGTEVFNVYDNEGHLQKNYNRAEFTTYLYDFRGRPTKMLRRLAKPIITSVSPTSSGSTGSGSGATSSTPASVEGVVVDALDNPIAGVAVSLNGSAQRTEQTDVNGQYSFPELATGSYSVNVTFPNCSFAPSSVGNLNNLHTAATLDFQGNGAGCGGAPNSSLIPTAGPISITGTIADPNGNGVSGVTIEVLNGSYQAVTHSDTSGAYSFSGLAPGSYSVNPSGLQPGCSVNPTVVNLNNLTESVSQNFSGSASCNLPCSQAVACSPTVAVSGDALDSLYAPHVYQKAFTEYTAANLIATETTGADVDAMMPGGRSQITYEYDLRDNLYSVASSYGNSGGVLLASSATDAAGAVLQRTFGDAAKTTESMAYDANETLTGIALQRAAGSTSGAWTTYASMPPVANDPQNTLQTVLTNVAIAPDRLGTPTRIAENTTTTTSALGAALMPVVTSQWPKGAKPIAFQSFKYWDDYRLGEASTSYSGDSQGNDSFTSPYSPAELASSSYPPLAPVSTKARVRDQQYVFDWRGNLVQSTDNASDFFDRSLGTATNGIFSQPPGSPDQMTTASLGSGLAQVKYDAAGNVVLVSDSLVGVSYQYQWDEIGRMSNVTRLQSGTPAFKEVFAYNGSGGRVLETQASLGPEPTVDHTVQVFDTLMLQHASFDPALGDYERDAKTEHVYIAAGGALAHAFYAEVPLPTATGSGNIHVFMGIGDALGSTSFVIDHDTGELVERTTYYPFGGVESDYRPSRWDSFREDIKYTGHWDDGRVGLIYFGARSYSPQLGIFLSPDPLTVHGLRGDPNPYAFVHGSPIGHVDPFGLDDEDVADTVPTWVPTDGSGITLFAPGTYTSPTITIVGTPDPSGASGFGPTASDAPGGLSSDFEPGGVLSDFQVDRNGSAFDSAFADVSVGVVALLGPENTTSPAADEGGARAPVAAVTDAHALGSLTLAAAFAATGGAVSDVAGRWIGGAVGHAFGTAAAEAVPSVVEDVAATGIQSNRAAGNAFRDEIARALQNAGREVQTEVYKSTPFGRRFIDIEVSLDGEVLGGVETKLGNSRYTTAQQSKDQWLWLTQSYRVNVVRGP